MFYSFTEEEFVEQVQKSKSWGEPTTELMNMMEELIIEEARLSNAHDCIDKTAMIDSSIKDFESSGLLHGLIMNAQLTLPGVLDHFKSSICCTFNHYRYKRTKLE